MSNLEINAKAKGKFRVQKRNIDTGEIYYDSGEFSNMLLNNFFAQTYASLATCFVGTDATVSESDTTLSVIGTYTGDRAKNATASVDATGLVTWNFINTYTFNPGAIVGNMSCIGLSNSTALTGTNLKIKSLIKDVNGNPTAIPATATDQIIVTHTLTVTFNQHQNLGTITVDEVDYQVDFYGTFIALSGDANFTLSGAAPVLYYSGSSTAQYFRVGASFTVPTIPSSTFGTHGIVGTSVGGSNAGSLLNDTTNKKLIQRWVVQIASTFNLAGNAPIKFISGTGDSNAAYFSYVFTPALPKNNTIAYTMTIQLNLSRA